MPFQYATSTQALTDKLLEHLGLHNGAVLSLDVHYRPDSIITATAEVCLDKNAAAVVAETFEIGLANASFNNTTLAESRARRAFAELETYINLRHECFALTQKAQFEALAHGLAESDCPV